MNTKSKKALYESIMKSVAKTVKNNLNEAIGTDENGDNYLLRRNGTKLQRDKMRNFDNTNIFTADDEYMPYVDYLDICTVLSKYIGQTLPISLKLDDINLTETDDKLAGRVNNAIHGSVPYMIEYFIIEQLYKETLQGLRHISDIVTNSNSDVIDFSIYFDYDDDELNPKFRTDNISDGYNYNQLQRNFEVKAYTDFKNITLTNSQTEILKNDIVSINFILVNYTITGLDVTINDIYVVTPSAAKNALTLGKNKPGKHLSAIIKKQANDINDFSVISVNNFMNNKKAYIAAGKRYNNTFKKQSVNFTRGANKKLQY